MAAPGLMLQLDELKSLPIADLRKAARDRGVRSDIGGRTCRTRRQMEQEIFAAQEMRRRQALAAAQVERARENALKEEAVRAEREKEEWFRAARRDMFMAFLAFNADVEVKCRQEAELAEAASRFSLELEQLHEQESLKRALIERELAISEVRLDFQACIAQATLGLQGKIKVQETVKALHSVHAKHPTALVAMTEACDPVVECFRNMPNHMSHRHNKDDFVVADTPDNGSGHRRNVLVRPRHMLDWTVSSNFVVDLSQDMTVKSVKKKRRQQKVTSKQVTGNTVLTRTYNVAVAVCQHNVTKIRLLVCSFHVPWLNKQVLDVNAIFDKLVHKLNAVAQQNNAKGWVVGLDGNFHMRAKSCELFCTTCGRAGARVHDFLGEGEKYLGFLSSADVGAGKTVVMKEVLGKEVSDHPHCPVATFQIPTELVWKW